ncbi:GPP34 family phosphoprotein [Streptomyces sp. NPDC001262]|uniref:GPP34 family phosphoprotein n=1 Tax=unclassified Streptomyces TaxID=2593676 RepID=UPI00369995C7
MTTPRDLAIIAMGTTPGHPVEQGRLSLALAGAELIDLLAAEAVTLDDDRIVPGRVAVTADRLLDEAAAALTREAPHESVDDWLWRRGRGLAAAYTAALEADGQLTRQRPHWKPFGAGRTTLTDSLDRRLAEDRWAADEPVLTALATAVGIRDEGPEDIPVPADDVTATVLAAVNDALLELEAARQRRDIEQAAFDNIWRGQ